MIEIVLRKDIAEFEPKPFFGFTARQIMTGVLAGVVSVGAYALMRFVLHLPETVAGYSCMISGVLVGAAGLGRVRGLKPESWLRITAAELMTPKTMAYARPVMHGFPASPYDVRKARPKRADSKVLKSERSEILPEDLEG